MLSTDGKAASLLIELDRRIVEQFPNHPFESGLDALNFKDAITQYLAMSTAFPYIQAGAIYQNYKHAKECVGDTDDNTQITAAIGSFLIWDEFGGHLLTRKRGNEGLRQLTKVSQNFHSTLLRRDIERLLGTKIEPRWSTNTTEYLNALLEGLSDRDRNRNVAYMIAFEKHADIMIRSLWHAVCRVFGVPKDTKLKYFYAHVGGNEPAEAVHVEMTRKMVRHLIPEETHKSFLQTCMDGYALNIHWCKSVLIPNSSIEATATQASRAS